MTRENVNGCYITGQSKFVRKDQNQRKKTKKGGRKRTRKPPGADGKPEETVKRLANSERTSTRGWPQTEKSGGRLKTPSAKGGKRSMELGVKRLPWTNPRKNLRGGGG